LQDPCHFFSALLAVAAVRSVEPQVVITIGNLHRIGTMRYPIVLPAKCTADERPKLNPRAIIFPRAQCHRSGSSNGRLCLFESRQEKSGCTLPLQILGRIHRIVVN
jgi:hypothetical protein